MEADQILATGGAGGITGVALFILYKLLNKHIKSKCCGVEVEIEDKNIQVKVDEAPIHHPPSNQRNDERPPGSPISQNQGRETSQTSSSSKGECSSSNNFTTENPLTITIPKHS